METVEPTQAGVPHFSRFVSSRTGQAQVVTFTARAGVSEAEMKSLAQQLSNIRWETLSHAYGKASDVPALLFAVTLGAGDVRREAWWELWGNIHHQGTVYTATVPAVPFVVSIAGSALHPERVNAISFLRQVAVADGSAAADVRRSVREHADGLVAAWREEPDLVQRALLLLVSAFPDLAARYQSLEARLPNILRVAWDDLAAAGGFPSRIDVDDDTAMDRQDALEAWALAGWSEPG